AAIEKARQEGGDASTLKAKVDAINDEFEIEERRRKELEKLGEDADQKTKDRVNKLFDDLKTERENQLKEELADAAAAETQRENQRAAERQKIIDDLNTKRQDRIDA